MKSQKKRWLIAGAVVLLLIVGVWAHLTFGPVNRVLSDREAEAYRAYDITLPQGGKLRLLLHSLPVHGYKGAIPGGYLPLH